MLIRFHIDNILSFGTPREFNMIPRPKIGRLSHHKYEIDDFEFLKISAIYGANGSGKSNLIRALTMLIDIVINSKIPSSLNDKKYKLSKRNLERSQILAVEFIKNNTAYYYGIEINNGIVITEELYISGLGKKEDKLLFERKTDENHNRHIRFDSKFDLDNENLTLRNILEKTLSKPEQPVFKLLSDLENEYLNAIKTPFEWFNGDVEIIIPSSKPRALVDRLDANFELKDFANKTMCSFDTGIKKIEAESIPLKVFTANNPNSFEDISKLLEQNPEKRFVLKNEHGEEVVALLDEGNMVVKRLVLKHEGEKNNLVEFHLDEESDGTNRLLDYIPAFMQVVNNNKVFIIDEIERSIHPLLIKELIRKYSLDENTSGQLIFSTHESNLLDQEILRQDEIWFMEKDASGKSDMYPLSEFKEHHTKDIKRGYLNGRYGAIPFLGNLKDLNWNIWH